MKQETQAEIHPSRNSGQDAAGVVRFMDQSSRLDKELITIGNTIEEAIGRAVIRDDNQRNKIVRYMGRLKECHLLPQMELLRIWINASFAVGGHQRDEALMSNAHLWVPEGGRRMDKKQINRFLDIQARKADQRNNSGEKREEGDNTQ